MLSRNFDFFTGFYIFGHKTLMFKCLLIYVFYLFSYYLTENLYDFHRTIYGKLYLITLNVLITFLTRIIPNFIRKLKTNDEIVENILTELYTCSLTAHSKVSRQNPLKFKKTVRC